MVSKKAKEEVAESLLLLAATNSADNPPEHNSDTDSADETKQICGLSNRSTDGEVCLPPIDGENESCEKGVQVSEKSFIKDKF